MCLQLCHVIRQIIDNDLACDHCAPSTRNAHRDKTCALCRHCRIRAEGAPMCGLTRATLPPAQTCCHWNVALETRAMLTLTLPDIAPNAMDYHRARTVAELFDRSDSAPVYQRVEDSTPHGVIRVALADLAVPLVYGLPAGDWERVPVVFEPDMETAIGAQVQEALLYLAEGDVARADAALQKLGDFATLPVLWRDVVLEADALIAQQVSRGH